MLCGTAQPQSPGLVGTPRLVATDAVQLLHHPDPVVRGEAALIAAATAERGAQTLLLQLAADPAPAARLRALIALGLLGTPAAIDLLDGCLRDTGTRGEADGTAAAFGLGLAPAELAQGAVNRLLLAVGQGSWRRQRDTLCGLLLGALRRDQPIEPAILRLLLDDDSNRDGDVRSLLLHHVLQGAPDLATTELRRWLDRGTAGERLVVLGWLCHRADLELGELVPVLTKLVQRGALGRERALALGALTRMRLPNALELAPDALSSGDTELAAQALRTMLGIGGARFVAALEQRILVVDDAAQRLALLEAFQAPLSTALADACVAIAADPRLDHTLRCRAALVLHRHRPERSQALLGDLFRADPPPPHATDDRLLTALAQARLGSGGDTPALSRLLDGIADLGLDPARWTALLHAGHAAAERQLVRRLGDRTATPGQLAVALTSWRRAQVLSRPDWPTAAVPTSLLDLLGH
jgi:hypothetical protein